MKTLKFVKVMSFCWWLLFAQSVWAVVFEVTTADEFQASLTAAASNGGDDIIYLSSGLYRGSFKYWAEEDFGLKIAAKIPDESTTIDAGDSGFGLLIEGNERSFSVVVENLVIKNALNNGPGGAVIVRSVDGLVALRGVTLSENVAQLGAAAYFEDLRELTIENSRVARNRGTSIFDNGHALYLESVWRARLEKVSFIDNETGDFALDRNNRTVHDRYWKSGETGSQLEIKDSEFINRSPVYGSLKITSRGSANLTAELGIVIKGNSFDYWLRGSPPLYLSAQGEPFTFQNNQLRIKYVDSEFCGDLTQIELFPNFFADLKPTIEHIVSANIIRVHGLDDAGSQMPVCGRFVVGNGGKGNNQLKFYDNLLVGSSIAVYAEENVREIAAFNNTIVEFLAPTEFNFTNGPVITVANNIVVSTKQALDIKLNGTPNRAFLRNNIIGKTSGFWDLEENNLASDPKFFDPDNGDFHLTEDSPGVNAGNNDYVDNDTSTDLEGNPRITEGTVDIGAYERITAGLHPADTNGDSTISAEEFDLYNAAWRANDSWPTSPSQIPVDFVTRAGYLLQKGGAYKNIGVGKPATWVPVNE